MPIGSSINVELPTEASLTRLAPEKNASGIKRWMAATRALIDGRRRATQGVGHDRTRGPAGSRRPARARR